MADPGLRLADVLDPWLFERSRSVLASYARQVSDLGIPSYEGLVAGHTITLYHCLPWLFSDAVTGLSEAQHHDLAVAGLLYFGHALLVDRLIDGDDEFSPRMLLSSDALHERSLVILAGAHMLGESSAQALLRYTRAYERAIACEHGAAHNETFGWTDYHAVATGKAALLKAAPALMTVAAGREELGAATDEMVDLFNLAAQIHDDVKDWRKDVPAGRPGLILALAQLANIERADINALLQRPEEHIAHWLFMEGHAERALAEGMQAAARASELASSIGANRWSRATKYYSDRLARLREQLSRTRHRVAAKAATPLRTRDGQMTRSAVSWLLDQVDPGVDGHAHRMTFEPRFGFSAESPQQVGAVFCRAVSGWALTVARAHGIRVPSPALRGNLAALWALRRGDEVGGWSYFPGLPELPPDADDVGQVALACGTTAPSPMMAALADARELILEQHVRADGAIGTWLTNSRSSPDLVMRYDHAIRTKWGRAFDPEVTSNLVFGLAQAGLGLPDAVVRRAASWVADSQCADGSWTSAWYVGQFYGTYVCTRFLASVEGCPASLRRATTFLLGSQRADGGWGGDSSDSLSTALAVLAALEVDSTSARDAARRGVEYLRLTQRDSGDWREVPLVQMDLERAHAGSPARMLYHGSPLLTTSYALAAIARSGWQ